MDIEQTAKTAPEKIFKMPIDPLLGYLPEDGYYLGSKAGRPSPSANSFPPLSASFMPFAKSATAR